MNGLSRNSKLFGSRRKTEVLLLVALLEETYPSELTRLLGAEKASVQRIVDDLEGEGVLASRRVGRTRLLQLEPRHFAAKELQSLLRKLASGEPTLQAAAAKRRSRPRRKGK